MEKNPKFEVGDRVKVVKIITDTGYRDELVGKEFTIASINPNGKSRYTHYGVSDPHCYYIFYEEELKLVNNPHWIHKPCNVRSFFALECPRCHKTLYASSKYYPYCPYCGKPMEKPNFNNKIRVSPKDIDVDFLE